MKRKHIIIFEHQSIKLGQVFEDIVFDEAMLNALQNHFGENGVPYYSLIRNGVKFNEYVGVIQVGNLVIEVLPKADKNPNSDEEKVKWQNILIGMLRAVGSFDIKSTSESLLRINPNTILDLYFELFIKEVEYLLHKGLVKKYRKTEGNVNTLKGSLQFGKHIQKNVTHQERFFVRYTTYDTEHQLHHILYKTIRLLKQINTNSALHSRIGVLLLNFPEMPDIKISENTFEKLAFNRKTKIYKRSIGIAKLLLLQYHPDISKGRNYVLALMFDMNMLWEQFIYVSLRKHILHGTTITAQTSKFFWKPKNGYRSKIRPDIVINKDDKDNCFVLDTKWKNINGNNPSADDLRQMYVYQEYYDAKKVALIYPGLSFCELSGSYLDPKTSIEIDKGCSVISLSVDPIIKQWQKKIFNEIENWMINN